MKQTYFLLACSFAFSLLANAQSGNAVIFTELGEKFTAYLNGEKQNETPSNNVKIEDLSSEFYQVRIDFEDDGLPDFHNNNFAIQFDATTTYMVKANKKGAYVLRFHNSTPIEATAVENVRPVETSKPIAETTTTTSEPTPTMNTNVTVTETTTQQTTTAPNGETISISMNVGGTGINLNMNVDDADMGYTETVQTTTVTSGGSTQVTKPIENEEAVVSTSTGGCSYPMNSTEFSDAKKSIQSKSFEDSKLSIAKQITKGKCLTAEQVRDVMKLFDFEETRLDFAKFAFDYTYDTDNYYKVSDAFDFEMSIEELDEYLSNKQ